MMRSTVMDIRGSVTVGVEAATVRKEAATARRGLRLIYLRHASWRRLLWPQTVETIQLWTKEMR
jgi:hypothetical protein